MYGTSGGALTGCLLFLDIDLDALAEYVFICVAKARSSWRGKFLLREYCRAASISTDGTVGVLCARLAAAMQAGTIASPFVA